MEALIYIVIAVVLNLITIIMFFGGVFAVWLMILEESRNENAEDDCYFDGHYLDTNYYLDFHDPDADLY